MGATSRCNVYSQSLEVALAVLAENRPGTSFEYALKPDLQQPQWRRRRRLAASA